MDSIDIVKHLPAHLLDQFAALEDLFGSDGWKLIMKHAEQRCVDWFTSAANAPTWEANRVANGHRYAWKEVLELEAQLMAQFELLAGENSEAEEDFDE